jgi:CrcB protein
MTRYWLSELIAHRWPGSFPWGTLTVNVTGSFLIGLLASLINPAGQLLLARSAQLFVLIGILGGFTTFSSFSLQTLHLARDGHFVSAGAYVIGSVVLCLSAVWLGFMLAQMWHQHR